MSYTFSELLPFIDEARRFNTRHRIIHSKTASKKRSIIFIVGASLKLSTLGMRPTVDIFIMKWCLLLPFSSVSYKVSGSDSAWTTVLMFREPCHKTFRTQFVLLMRRILMGLNVQLACRRTLSSNGVNVRSAHCAFLLEGSLLNRRFSKRI
jgi:hypothetical protein